MDGKIVAPSDKSGWVKYDLQWILFMGINKGITIKGKGVIDGCGLSWWNSDDESVIRPHVSTIVVIKFITSLTKYLFNTLNRYYTFKNIL